jgi:hypothetical protein
VTNGYAERLIYTAGSGFSNAMHAIGSRIGFGPIVGRLLLDPEKECGDSSVDL